MARDSLFPRQPSYPSETSSTSLFSSPEDVSVARAFTDVLLTEGDKWQVTSLSSLQNRFSQVNAADQFRAWTHGNTNAVVSDEKLQKALGADFLNVVYEHSGVQREEFFRRLPYVFPTVVRQLSTKELAESARAFQFSLNELRRRLVIFPVRTDSRSSSSR